MDNIENRLESASKEIEFVQQAADIGLRVAEPLERINNKLTKALILTNAFWAIVLALFIAFAYLAPAEMEQSQNMPEQSQTQTTKGVN